MGLVGDGDYAPEGEFASGSGDWNSEQRKGQRGGLGLGLYRRDGAWKKERERGTAMAFHTGAFHVGATAAETCRSGTCHRWGREGKERGEEGKGMVAADG